jgi:hypothetical protein
MEIEITTINRGFITILPKQPYYDWANAVFKDDTPMRAADKEATAYAISDDFGVRDLADVVKRHYALIFEEELFGVCTDPDQWPAQRTWKMFDAWFSYHVGSIMWDLSPELPLEHDDD